jgi:hypothetical protein
LGISDGSRRSTEDREGHDFSRAVMRQERHRLQPLRLAKSRAAETPFAVESTPQRLKPAIVSEDCRHEWNSCPSRSCLGQRSIQLMILFVGAAIGSHHLRPHHPLRGDDIVQVMLQRPLQNEPLRLPVLLGHGDELFVELRIDFRSDFDCARHMVGH